MAQSALIFTAIVTTTEVAFVESPGCIDGLFITNRCVDVRRPHPSSRNTLHARRHPMPCGWARRCSVPCPPLRHAARTSRPRRDRRLPRCVMALTSSARVVLAFCSPSSSSTSFSSSSSCFRRRRRYAPSPPTIVNRCERHSPEDPPRRWQPPWVSRWIGWGCACTCTCTCARTTSGSTSRSLCIFPSPFLTCPYACACDW